MKLLAFFNTISSMILAFASVAIIVTLFQWKKILGKQNEVSAKQNELLDRQNKILEKQLSVSNVLEEKKILDGNNRKTKRILAREGLVLISLALLGALREIFFIYRLNQNALKLNMIAENSDRILAGAFSALIYIYPVYLFLRFIVWAINTLRK